MRDDGAGSAGNRRDVWALWARLRGFFPSWSLGLSSLYTPGAWGYFGVDFVSGFRRNRSTIQTFALLEDVDEATFDALSALASLNARRQEQMLRAVVLGYLTVPLSITALIAEISGDSLMAFVNANRLLAIQIAVTATAVALGYMMSHWRSRQIIGVLDLVRIERSQSRLTTLQQRED